MHYWLNDKHFYRIHFRKRTEMVVLSKTEDFRREDKLFINQISRITLSREQALDVVLKHFQNRDVVVGTTGMLSRELFELRMKRGDGHERDFLTVGGMGHASSIALGIALQKPHRTVSLHRFQFIISNSFFSRSFVWMVMVLF